jgi:transcriptional regulator with XRE-family HTH domain
MSNRKVRQMNSSVVPQWTLADRLRKAREAAHLDQKDIAEALGVTQAAVSRWECGGKPRNVLAVVSAWAEATNVDQLWLLGFTDGNNDPRDFQMDLSLAA